MQTLTTAPITKAEMTEDTAFSLTPAGLAALEGFAPTNTQNALEALETAPEGENGALQGNEAFCPDTADKVDWVIGKIADHRARAGSKFSAARTRAI